MKKLIKFFFDLFFNKKFSFSVLLICLFFSFTACGSDGGDDGGKPEVITVTIPGINNVELIMHWIPDGTFTMGSSNSLDNGANPPHEVTLTKGFYMGIYEVTQEQYIEVMGANPSKHPNNPAAGEEQGKRPVEQVNWYHAIAFCNRLSILQGLTPVYSISGKSNTDASAWFHSTVPTSGNATWNAAMQDMNANGYRLPTEAEWEYACRADTVKAYNAPPPDGSDVIRNDIGWYLGNSNSGSSTYKTHQVGLKSANAWGLHDMHGNVWEWCWDWYSGYASGAQTDPAGASGSGRVTRGGFWSDNEKNLRSAYRGIANPYYRDYGAVGFRVVRP